MAQATLEQVRCFAYREAEGARWVKRPVPGDGDVRVAPVAVGLDGTDEAVASGSSDARPPPGRDDLVLGHEALLRVLDGPLEGRLVVPTVRRPCSRCAPCHEGRSDLCETGLYTEHGITGLDGWLADAARARREELIPVPEGTGLEAVLAEPLSIGVKALEHAVAVRQARRGGYGERPCALVVGLGSLGSTAALLLRDRGFDVVALSRTPDAAERAFCEAVGAHLTKGPPRTVAGAEAFDLVIETPGKGRAIADALDALAPNGVLVTLGTPRGDGTTPLPSDRMVRDLVLHNQSLLGSVNSQRSHFEEALAVLGRWRQRAPHALDLLLERRWPPERVAEALTADAPLKRIVVWP